MHTYSSCRYFCCPCTSIYLLRERYKLREKRVGGRGRESRGREGVVRGEGDGGLEGEGEGGVEGEREIEV